MTEPTAAPTWATLESSAPDMATVGRNALQRAGILQGLLATVAGNAPPRLHPIWVGIVDGHLVAFLTPSAKRRDLEADGRYALHSHVGPDDLDEFSVRGHARGIKDAADRARIAANWPFTPDDMYELFELSVESALLGRRADADEWPPRYTSWRAPTAAQR